MEINISNKQKEIIDYNDEEDILVIACPGSGKTHTIICKYIKLINNNIYKPNEIILITFTKKAGNELCNRLNKMMPNNEPLYVGTIHGFAYKILKKYNKINSTILNEIDYKNYILNIDELNNYDKIIKKNIISIIEQISNSYPLDLTKVLLKNNLDKYYNEFENIYKIYQEKKKKENYIDFNDLMILFSNFLDDDLVSLDFKNNIKYIFFDEYQDINPIQNYILLKLNEKSKLMLVGDDAQSIYSFRGSNIDYILNYKKKIFFLEENFRSTISIINICQDIINKNTSQIYKNVISKEKTFSNNLKPIIYHFDTYLNLYKWLSNKILKKKILNYNLSNTVIMARTNNILENLEIHLSYNKIKYTKHIGTLLLNKSHIKDFLSFIVISYNPNSSIHWLNILCLNNNLSINEANEIIKSTIGSNILNKIKDKKLIKLYKKISKVNGYEKIILILDYFKENFNLSKNDLNDIEKLIKYFKIDNSNELNNFINNIYLDYDILNEDKINSLYLTTIHGAKGLEWKNVYLIDSNCSTSKSMQINIEEERRLLYVAASRAKVKLNILCLNNKSNLLNEIDENLYKSIYKE
jgi:DNA helicase-2/ATP-dependent DNA helicase PcrA